MNPFIEIKKKRQEIDKLVSQIDPITNTFTLDSSNPKFKESDNFLFILKEENRVIEPKHRKQFFNIMSEIIQIYWNWIDSKEWNFMTKKFFSFCDKAYPEAKIPFENYYKAFKYMERRIPRAYGLITNPEQNKIFLIKNHAPNEQYTEEVGWSLAGGKVAFDENYEECLKRELKEEIGILLEDEQILYCKNFTLKNREIRIYYIILPENKYQSKNTFEIAETGWFCISKLPKLVCVASHALKQFNIQNSEAKWKNRLYNKNQYHTNNKLIHRNQLNNNENYQFREKKYFFNDLDLITVSS